MPTLKIISHNFPASLDRQIPGEGGHLRIAANSYVTTSNDTKNNDGKISLVFAHATGFHKELWNPIIKLLHERRHRWNGGDMWALDCSNHGNSAILNQDILPDKFVWTDYTRDILQLIDKAKIQKPIIGIGHSLGGTCILMAEIIRPGTFDSILVIEPGLKPTTLELFEFKSTTITNRRDRWPNREAAHANFSKSKFFQSWDPEMLNLYVQYGLYELPSGEVTLKCPKTQEFCTFFDINERYSTFHQMSKIQCPILFVVGNHSNFDYQDLALHKMSQCQRSELISIDASHLVPMEKPIQVAYAIEYFARKFWKNNDLLQKNQSEGNNVRPVLATL
ncbi:Alpha/beta hydrolase family-domain-containing protein [Gigaspora rosea]|uniref:Alpha/beta hydrolase family-domain-containing protein n=1 Tax=Gigaspora rosea TaxID=44941 RepID=A0A397UNJ4_9GLOM|nr:Alpha/beta hydrolase family-domain-containing protein [Gigaspora rosea]